MGIRIRDANIADGSEIIRLIRLLVEMDGELASLNLSDVERYLKQPDAHILLAEADGVAVGLISYSVRMDLFHGDPVCHIGELVVIESRRGDGIGGTLVEEVVRRAGAQTCAEISVSTLFSNQKAISFYKRHGFLDEALLLEKHLN